MAVLPVWTSRPAGAQEPEGSGVVVGDGTLLITADHILGNAVRVRVRSMDGEIAEAGILARDSETDLALLKIPFALPPLEPAGYPAVGETACAVGNAFGLGVSVTCGTISAVRKSGVGFNPIEDFVQTDAAVNPGMSGGALVDKNGALIGILSAIFTKQSDANIGVNFAVSGPLAGAALVRLQSDNAAAWPTAGLQLRPYPPPGGTGRAGAVIVDIEPGGAAASGGLEVGDVITRAGDRRIFGPADMRAAVAMQSRVQPLAVSILRNGQEHTLQIAIAE
ncbi:MAG TPA: trypsin-like peptidase domain-containing protein [Afifellaceae bacterium]|nr:trypsin-like peptidase domain-containing protein [Afifellaceae bacterium]